MSPDYPRKDDAEHCMMPCDERGEMSSQIRKTGTRPVFLLAEMHKAELGSFLFRTIKVTEKHPSADVPPYIGFSPYLFS